MQESNKSEKKKVSFAPTIEQFINEKTDLDSNDTNANHIHNHKNIGRNHLCLCGSGKKFKKCCLNKSEHEVVTQQLDKITINSNIYQEIEIDMRAKYVKEFGEIKTGDLIPITKDENVQRHAKVIAFWLKEASSKDYEDSEKNLHKFAMCSTNASNLVERSHKIGILSDVINLLRGIYEGYLYFNKKTVQLLIENEFDIDFNIPSLVIDDK